MSSVNSRGIPTILMILVTLLFSFTVGCNVTGYSTTFACDSVSVTYTNTGLSSPATAEILANGTVIASINTTVASGTVTVSGSFPLQPDGTSLSLRVNGDIVATGSCVTGATWFNPGDGRAAPLPGDRIAVYCDQTTATVIIYGVKEDSTGFLLGSFKASALLAAGPTGLSLDKGAEGVISAASDEQGNLWIAWNGGSYKADGQVGHGFAKGLNCQFKAV